VADSLEGPPGQVELAVEQAKLGLDGLDNFGPTRMAHPDIDVLDGQVVRREQAADVVAQVLLDQLGYLDAEHHLQAGGPHIPAHCPFGTRVEMGARVDDPGPTPGRCSLAADEYNGGTAVAEQAGRHHVRR